jgi:hypothetical protein
MLYVYSSYPYKSVQLNSLTSNHIFVSCSETINPKKCSLWIQPTDALSSNFITGISTLHVSGSVSSHQWVFLIRTLATDYIHYHPAPGSTRSPKCINCTNAVVRLRISWWWAERLPETCIVEIPVINLEFSASVGFIHKESITMHGHTILKFLKNMYKPYDRHRRKTRFSWLWRGKCKG